MRSSFTSLQTLKGIGLSRSTWANVLHQTATQHSVIQPQMKHNTSRQAIPMRQFHSIRHSSSVGNSPGKSANGARGLGPLFPSFPSFPSFSLKPTAPRMIQKAMIPTQLYEIRHYFSTKNSLNRNDESNIDKYEAFVNKCESFMEKYEEKILLSFSYIMVIGTISFAAPIMATTGNLFIEVVAIPWWVVCGYGLGHWVGIVIKNDYHWFRGALAGACIGPLVWLILCLKYRNHYAVS